MNHSDLWLTGINFTPNCSFLISSALVVLSLLSLEYLERLQNYSFKQGCHTSGKSQGNLIFFKVRELSGNFQGILQTVREIWNC